MLSLFAILLLTLIIFITISNVSNRRRVNHLARIPGPRHDRVLGALRYFLNSPDETWKNFRSFAKNYYPIYKFWLINVPVVNLLLPEDVEILLSSTKNIQKSVAYLTLKPWLGRGILNSSGNRWYRRRKLVTPAFHLNFMHEVVPICVEHSDNLCRVLKDECVKGATNLEDIISEYTLSATCEALWGVKLDSKTFLIKNYFRAVDRFGEFVAQQISQPWTVLFPLTFWKRKTVLETIHEFARLMVAGRQKDFNSLPSTKRLLDLLLTSKSSEQLTEKNVLEEVNTFLFASYDNTAKPIYFSLWLLAQHPDEQQKVFEELREVFSSGTSLPTTYESLKKLQYLDQVVKESLRLFPSVPLISRKLSHELKTHSGYVLPEGTNVIVHIFDVHHNPTLYPNPYEFDPERFSLENCKTRHPHAYLPFAAGPRSCIGQKFAMLLIKSALSAILRQFVVEAVDTTVSFTAHLVLKTKRPVRVKFRRRLM